MITELELVPHVVTPGEKIQVQEYNIRNVHLHQVLNTISRSMNAIIEMDMGNSGSGLSQGEASAINADWNRINTEWQRALQHRSLAPTGGLEAVYSILMMTQNQMLMIRNVRAQRVVQAYWNLGERIINSDSSSLEYDIQTVDEHDISEHFAYINSVLSDYVGFISGEEYTRGMMIPAHTHLGTVSPPENMGESQIREPGPEAPQSIPVPDVPDSPSTASTPGTNTNA